jgi:hypothetical protein
MPRLRTLIFGLESRAERAVPSLLGYLDRFFDGDRDTDERRSILLRTLVSMLGPTRVAPGCLDARLYSNLDKRKALLFVEDWASLAVPPKS